MCRLVWEEQEAEEEEDDNERPIEIRFILSTRLEETPTYRRIAAELEATGDSDRLIANALVHEAESRRIRDAVGVAYATLELDCIRHFIDLHHV